MAKKIRKTIESSVPEPCTSHRLALSDIGGVTICPDCGVVHLSLQNISLRLSPADFQVLARMLGEAQVNLGSLIEDILMSSGQSSVADQFGAARMKTH